MVVRLQLEKWLVVVPARLHSQRLRHKPTQLLGGRELVIRTVDNLQTLVKQGAKLVVAVDDERTEEVCHKYGIPCVMTSKDHTSGTDRVWEAAQTFGDSEFILNVQCDEPFLSTSDLSSLCRELEQASDFDMATLVHRSKDVGDFNNPNVVKAIVSSQRQALYFTRSPCPVARGRDFEDPGEDFEFWQHVGVYAYRRMGLKAFCSWPPSPLEDLEKLEQLRALENRLAILAIPAKVASLGIDTPEDLVKAQLAYEG